MVMYDAHLCIITQWAQDGWHASSRTIRLERRRESTETQKEGRKLDVCAGGLGEY